MWLWKGTLCKKAHLIISKTVTSTFYNPVMIVIIDWIMYFFIYFWSLVRWSWMHRLWGFSNCNPIRIQICSVCEIVYSDVLSVFTNLSITVWFRRSKSWVWNWTQVPSCHTDSNLTLTPPKKKCGKNNLVYQNDLNPVH